MMTTKIYDKLKIFIKKYYKHFLFLVITIFILNIKLPYVVMSPGGTIKLENRISINGKYVKNNYYATYVNVSNGNIASLILGFVMPKWDIIKLSDYTSDSNLTYDEVSEIEKLSMLEGDNISIINAFNKLGIDYDKNNYKLFVYYKLEEYKNNLKIGDQIISCDNNKVYRFDELTECVNSSRDNNVDLSILRDNKTYEISVPLYMVDNKKVMGVRIYEDFKINSKYNVEIHNDKNESGSSAGFINSLMIYDALSKSNLSKNRKIVGTGTIDENGNVGEIGGVKYKLLGSEKDGVDIFFCPEKNYKEAIKVKDRYNLKLEVVSVKNIDDAIEYLNKLK